MSVTPFMSDTLNYNIDNQLPAKKKTFPQDVKSANVLLDAYLRAKLGDFGLAKICNQAPKFKDDKFKQRDGKFEHFYNYE